MTLQKIFFGFYRTNFKILQNDERRIYYIVIIYRKTVDYMSRMALEKDDFRRFSVIWVFRVTGNWFEARVLKR